MSEWLANSAYSAAAQRQGGRSSQRAGARRLSIRSGALSGRRRWVEGQGFNPAASSARGAHTDAQLHPRQVFALRRRN
jgi:hypothetical protein